jgi:epoxyqueuosine reductase
VGISTARPARRLEAYINWLEKEHHGQMGYMARADRQARRRDLNVILPGVRSIVSLGMDYRPPGLPDYIVNDPGRGLISNYARATDYHHIVEDRLNELSDWLKYRIGGDATSKTYVDTGAILERDHGESAGLGFTGKNTMLIDPRRGSWFFIGEILTSARLNPTVNDLRKMPGCGSCHRCLDACPTAAFPAPYILDARRCISYLTIELKGWIPAELRPSMGNWIFGCDICQDVCPFNRFAVNTSEPAFIPDDWNSAAPRLLDVLALDETTFNERFESSPVKRIGRVRLLRNACVAAGNWGSQSAVPALDRLLGDPMPIIRGHAAWALGQIGGQEAVLALIIARKAEYDERVREEIVTSL